MRTARRSAVATRERTPAAGTGHVQAGSTVATRERTPAAGTGHVQAGSGGP